MKLKKLTALAIAFSLALPFQAVTIDTTNAKAAENLMANESVQYATVSSVDDFRKYIDSDGVFASQDTIETDWEGYTDVHKLVFEESGTLLIAALADPNYIKTEVFSNFALTAKIGDTISSIKSSRDNITSLEVKAGTYYYRGERWNGYEPLTITTYIGFIPDSNTTGDNKYDTSSDTSVALDNIPMISSPQGLTDYINSDGAYMSQDTIETDWVGRSTTYSFTVDEDGWLFAYPLCDSGYIDWKIYSNKALTSIIASSHTITSIQDEPVAVYLEAGTYYYNGDRWNGFDPITFTTYLAFMPASVRLSVQDITYSDDMTYATVTFNYDKDYLGSFTSGTIRLINDYLGASTIGNNDAWNTSTKENAIESATVKVTKNGDYTARIGSSADNYYCMVHFNISGLKAASNNSEKPAAPKIKTAKKGTKVVKGTCGANLKVTVKVGSKSYSTVSNSKGNWTVKLSKKLKSGNKVKAFVTNSKSVKSSTVTYKVK